MASGAQHAISYSPESVYGVTDSSPSIFALRNTGTTLNATKEQVSSDELRADRQIVDHRHGTKLGQGDITFELGHTPYDDLLEAVCGGTWTANVLKAGTTRRSFTIERQFADISRYLVFRGAEVNTLSVTAAPNSMIQGSFGIIAQSFGSTGTSLGSPTAASTNPPFDSFSGTIEEGGAPIGVISGIDFTLDNGMDPRYVVGSDETIRPSIGRSNLTGTVTAWFENAALLDKFIGETETSIEVEFSDGTRTLTFEFPRVKYTGGDVPVQGDGGILITLPFQALRDSSEASNIVITRSA